MTNSPDISALHAHINKLEKRLTKIEDEAAIRRLQYSYGYYLDKCLYEEVVDLFAEDGDVIFLRGRFKGKAGVRRLYIERFRRRFTNDHNGPVFGFLLDHPQMQGIVTISEDGNSANGRFRSVMQAGLHEKAGGNTRQWWEGGVYENQYVKVDDRWQIKLINYRPAFYGSFEEGWSHTKKEFVPLYTKKDLYPNDPNGPDEIDESYVTWPETQVVPFHYKHPITDTPWSK